MLRNGICCWLAVLVALLAPGCRRRTGALPSEPQDTEAKGTAVAPVERDTGVDNLSPKTSKAVLAIMADLDAFLLRLKYHGGQGDGAHESILLRVSDASGRTHPGWPGIRIAREQAGRIVDHLAVSGFFDEALDLTKVSTGPPLGSRYTIMISSGDDARYLRDWGWGQEMSKRLWALRKVLEHDAARAMDKLLKQLAEQEARDRARPKFTPRERLARAEKAFGERRYDDCLTEAKEALAAGATEMEADGAYTMMGTAYEFMGDLDAAIRMYRRGIEIAKKHHPKGSTQARLGPRIRNLEMRLRREGPREKVPAVVWGRLVDDSLQTGLSCERKSYEAGEHMELTVHVRNAGRKVSRAVADPEDPNFWKNCRPTFSPAGGGTPIVATRIGEVGESYKIRDVRFAVDERRATSLSIKKGRWNFRKLTRSRPRPGRGKSLYELPPGKYFLTVKVGGVTSGGVEIEITAKGEAD